MVKIRLMRVGKRKQPSYRVVVADARSPRDGRIIEAIGHYQPRQDPSVVEVDNERALYWLRNGAQPSDQVRQLLRITGAWSEFTGEAPISTPVPAGTQATGPGPVKVKATPAASVTVAEDTITDAADEQAAAADALEEATVAEVAGSEDTETEADTSKDGE